jgi:bifunctional non-homologous end joining protein LigD
MSLEKYRKKRKFDQTPEPEPGAAVATGNRFYIQRHSARRLHYDLRLEVDGTLKSWAVPKGPTLDPEIKRMAVHVEDHPLEYGTFEGTIPQGNYGAGTVLLWDCGTFELLGDKSAAEQLERGDFKFRLHGQKLAGEFALVRTKKLTKGEMRDWLLIKKQDFAVVKGWDAEGDLRSVRQVASGAESVVGAVKADMPKALAPMLAVLSEKLPVGPEWVYEPKWDGVRALCFLKDGKTRVMARSGREVGEQYPEVCELAKHLGAETAIIDGEIVAVDEDGRPNFGLLQQRIGASGSAKIAAERPVMLFAFDLLYLNGYDLRSATLEDRKARLKAVIRQGALVRYSEHFAGRGQELLDAAKEHELEGVVAKRATSRYESRRSGEWVKVKCVSQQELVICGFTKGEREPFGALVLGYWDSGKLVFAGNVGTGFDQRALDQLGALLKPLVRKKTTIPAMPKLPDVITWVEPTLVCTVKYLSWTKDGRLRAPVYLGLRQDLDPGEVTREKPEPVEKNYSTLEETTEAWASTTTPLKPPDGLNGEPGPGPHLPKEGRYGAPLEPLLDPGKAEQIVAVNGQQLKFTNLNKVFYPKQGYKKRDLINYYHAVAPLILPHLKDRPLSLKRYPNGIEADYFFQKNAALGTPEWIRREAIESEHRGEPINFVLAENEPSLLYLANLGCIDQNPWMSRVGSLDRPDFMLIDLDPVKCTFDRIVDAAVLVKRMLDELGLQGFPKTTGGDGMHIYVPLENIYSYEQVRSFAEIVARLAAGERPDLFTTPRKVEAREKGKVYFDYLQISESKTISAPYVLRAFEGAPVSTPLKWLEVTPDLTPDRFTLANAVDRFSRVGDLFGPVLRLKQRLEPALEKLAERVSR